MPKLSQSAVATMQSAPKADLPEGAGKVMHANRDDRRNHYRRKSNTSARVIALISAVSCSWALAYLYAPRFHIQFDKQNGSLTITKRSVSPAPTYEPQMPVQTYAPQPVVPKPLPQPAVPVEQYQRQEPKKQTVFNDSNYVPRGAINSMAPPVLTAYSQPQRVQQRSQSQTRFVRSAKWEWDQGHDKKKVWGRFEWVEVGGSIEWGSVCQNYRKGSIIYRDCRKGAKVSLINMCGSYTPACMANNGFFP